jgi:hypothetical protein
MIQQASQSDFQQAKYKKVLQVKLKENEETQSGDSQHKNEGAPRADAGESSRETEA